MSKKLLCALWGGLFILCAGLGFIPGFTQKVSAGAQAVLTVLAVAFFAPPACLIYGAKKEKDARTLKLVRGISLLSLGLTLLAGSGPRIPISIVPVGSVQTDFETEFEACGINQTRHKVYLQLSASIRIVIPTGAKTTNVTANMLVAESIIVGKVPESFVGYRLSEEELNMAP